MSVDFMYMDTLAATTAGVAVAKARPKDSNMLEPRLGTQRSNDGVWPIDACAYCCYRPRAPDDKPLGHPQNWFYGTGDGSHNPYRCPCFKRFLAEGGDSAHSEFASHLRACLRYDPRENRAKAPSA